MRRLLVFLFLAAGAFGQSESFNHVHWTMAFDQSTAAPGATVQLPANSRKVGDSSQAST